MARPVEKEFAQKHAGSLRTDKAHLAQIGLVKKRVENEAQLRACLRYFCNHFAPFQRMDEPMRQRGLGILYTLFARSAALAGQLNDLAGLIPAMKAPQTADEILFLGGWAQLASADQIKLVGLGNQARQRLSDTRTLITPLVKAYAKKNNHAPGTTAELFGFNPAPDSQLRPEFDRIALECSKFWASFSFYNGHLVPNQKNLTLLDSHFAEFTQFLKTNAADPLVFFQVLNWIREGGAEDVVSVDGDRVGKKIGLAWQNVWQELYLEACFFAIEMAGSQWNVIAVYNAKGFPADDYEFFIRPIRGGASDRPQELLLARVKGRLLDFTASQEITIARRRNDRFADYSGYQLLDELEIIELQNTIADLQESNPDAVMKRYIHTASAQAVFDDDYHVNQTVFDELTIVWIEEKNRTEMAIVEFHAMDCVLFRMDGGHLREAVKEGFYKELAKNAEALKAFLLAYLEVLGLVLDVITAGASGGFRRILFEFAKERLKDKLTDKALDALGVENQVIRTLAGMGANMVKLPKAKAHAKIDAATAESALLDKGTDFDPKTQRSTVNNDVTDIPPADRPPYSTQEMEALKANQIIGDSAFAKRAAKVKREKEAAAQAAEAAQDGRVKMASGTSGHGGDVVVFDAPHTTTVDLPANGVSRPQSGVPSAVDRLDSSLPRVKESKSLKETIKRILGERKILNPRKGKSTKAFVDGTPLMDAETRLLLGNTYDVKVAGTGGIHRITARKNASGELEVWIEGVLLPDELSRSMIKQSKGARKAANFNAVPESSGFRITEMQISGPRGEKITVHRAHLWGPALGDEAAAGMFLAPATVNLKWQNDGIEKYLRNLARKAGKKGGFVSLKAKATAWGDEVTKTASTTGEKFLKSVEYEFEVHMPGKGSRKGKLTLNVPQPPALDVEMARKNVWDHAEAEGRDLMKFAD